MEQQNVIYQTLQDIVDRVKYAPKNQPIEEMEDLSRFSSALKVSNLEGLLLVYLITCEELDGNDSYEKMLDFVRPICSLPRPRIMSSIRKLQSRRIIENQSTRRRMDIVVNQQIIEAIDSDSWEQLEAFTPIGLLAMLRSLHHQRNSMSRAIYFADPFHQKKSLWNLSVFEFNQELACVRYLRKHFQPLSTGEIQADVLLEILISKVSRNRDLYLEEWEGGEYGDTFDYRDFIENYIKTGKWLPIQEGLVAIYGADLTSDDITLELTERGINELLVELDPERKQRLTDLGSITVPYIKPENIVYQELFFGEDLQQQIEPLKKSLDPEIQEKIKLALTGKEFGLSGLFYGIPGSGKTELCYQLAKEYELPIMTVDVAKIQSKWVGESEKNAREIFASYRKLCRQTKKKCILLFNEADALFARRINVNSSVDQMNNALKNIFLEGMEQLNGVLLATTNLSANIDPAFERRFLFKIKFDLPSLQTQTRIWQSYFSTLSTEQAMHLAKRFNLSPGQIANVKRKQIIEEILYPEKVFFEVITQLASVERLVKDHETRMGF